jgi:hypothetical protein
VLAAGRVARGVGGRGALQWRGRVRHRRKRCSPMGRREAEEEGARCRATRGRAGRLTWGRSVGCRGGSRGRAWERGSVGVRQGSSGQLDLGSR